MCIIVAKPRGKKLKKHVLKNCWDRNNDGAGFMFTSDNKIIIRKELKNFDKLWLDYRNLIINKGFEQKQNVVFHFRIKTHGKIDEDNCHPFYVNNGKHMAFCHNGTISNVKADRKGNKSDTLVFRDKILDHLPKNWMNNPGICLLMAEFISYNKFAFLHADDTVTIINKSKGELDNGIWYSNTSYKPLHINRVDTTCRNHNNQGYTIFDKRNLNLNNGSEGIGYGDAGYDDAEYEEAWGQMERSNGLPGKGKTWDRLKQAYYYPVDHTDTDKINDEVRAATSNIDNPITTIIDLDTISEISQKLKGAYIIEADFVPTKKEIEDKTVALLAPKKEELIICKRCSAPIMSLTEIKDKCCAWCTRVMEENQIVIKEIKEEESGQSRRQLH